MHANHIIGKFVNDVCTKIDTNIPDAQSKEIYKNTLEGIPVLLLYFMCKGKDDDGERYKVYYFGI